MDDAVFIVPYDPAWNARYASEREAIVRALGDLMVGIEHFGSTAIYGMPSKPVIDILVLVEHINPAETYIVHLKPLGYNQEVWPGQPEEHLFFRKGSPRTHHLHIVRQGGPEHLRHLAFRDYLRAHPEACHRYAELKEDLAVKYCYERELYTSGKTSFIRSIEAQAMPAKVEPGQGE